MHSYELIDIEKFAETKGSIVQTYASEVLPDFKAMRIAELISSVKKAQHTREIQEIAELFSARLDAPGDFHGPRHANVTRACLEMIGPTYSER